MDAGIKNNNDNFNTSHVNVNRTRSNTCILRVRYFNTSHVNVNLSKANSTALVNPYSSPSININMRCIEINQYRIVSDSQGM